MRSCTARPRSWSGPVVASGRWSRRTDSVVDMKFGRDLGVAGQDDLLDLPAIVKPSASRPGVTSRPGNTRAPVPRVRLRRPAGTDVPPSRPRYPDDGSWWFGAVSDAYARRAPRRGVEGGLAAFLNRSGATSCTLWRTRWSPKRLSWRLTPDPVVANQGLFDQELADGPSSGVRWSSCRSTGSDRGGRDQRQRMPYRWAVAQFRMLIAA